ncbi:hypothetical protein EVAR_48467_1 [Eumeta japonica]|uniref:Uncharacterized protein n=1 Tax=Eumeta variegata TaxID=151549 RepID=A0A4C1XIH3_EUMVA|nr:hypothetical protein EVAR_48467_1 [Eumeta japonica]
MCARGGPVPLHTSKATRRSYLCVVSAPPVDVCHLNEMRVSESESPCCGERRAQTSSPPPRRRSGSGTRARRKRIIDSPSPTTLKLRLLASITWVPPARRAQVADVFEQIIYYENRRPTSLGAGGARQVRRDPDRAPRAGGRWLNIQFAHGFLSCSFIIFVSKEKCRPPAARRPRAPAPIELGADEPPPAPLRPPHGPSSFADRAKLSNVISRKVTMDPNQGTLTELGAMASDEKQLLLIDFLVQLVFMLREETPSSEERHANDTTGQLAGVCEQYSDDHYYVVSTFVVEIRNEVTPLSLRLRAPRRASQRRDTNNAI